MFCPWEPSQYLIFSSNILPLLFYSHIPSMIISLLIGSVIYIKNSKSLEARLIFIITSLFFIWSFFDLILGATNNPGSVIFFWSLQILIEPLIYICAVYLFYTFIYKKRLDLKRRILLFIPTLPIIALLSTKYTLIGVTLFDCNATEGFIAQYYTYGVEFLYVLIIFIIFIYTRVTKFEIERKNEIKYFVLGIILFLLSFSGGNIIGSFTDNWVLAQVGLIGMPIFVGFLTYMIVRFKSFHIKMLAVQVLAFFSLLFVSSLIFIREIQNVRVVVIVTLIFLIILTYLLIKSVKREVMQRESLEILSSQLFEANEKLKGLDKLKTEFVSLASHQLRSPLTAIEGYASMLMEGDYGEMNKEAKEAIDRMYESSKNLTIVVEDLLNVTKIESGGMKYEMIDFDLSQVADDEAKDFTLAAEKKGLKLNFEKDESTFCTVNGDKEKIRQIVINFIDNSVKYTKEGEVNVSVRNKGDKVIFCVKDTGMGMTEEVKNSLFQKFARGEGAKMNTTGTGLGLYLAKQIVEAHKGRVWVESDGQGKGSAFFMELDLIKN